VISSAVSRFNPVLIERCAQPLAFGHGQIALRLGDAMDMAILGGEAVSRPACSALSGHPQVDDFGHCNAQQNRSPELGIQVSEPTDANDRTSCRQQ
jgi:hypothetical protein